MDFNEFIVRFAATISRRKFLFFTLFIVIFASAVVGAYVKPQWYESQASLLITLQSPRVNSSRAEEVQITASVQPDEVMAKLAEIMKSRELDEELVDTLPPWVFEHKPSNKWYVRLIVKPLKAVVESGKDLLIKARLIEPSNPRFEKIKTIQKGLTVFPVRKAQVIEVTFSSKNPEVPPVVLRTLIDIFQQRLEALRSSTEGVKVYEARAEDLNRKLAAAEAARAAFMIENRIDDLEAERTNLMSRVAKLRLKSDEERLAKLVELEPQYNLLTRRVEILNESYGIYRKAAADRKAFFERDSKILARLLDPPQVIYGPQKPSRLTLVLLGFVLSLVLAVVFVMLVEWIVQIRRVYGREAAPTPFRRTNANANANPGPNPEPNPEPNAGRNAAE